MRYGTNPQASDKTDEQLVASFCHGNQESLGILVERHQRHLYFFCLRLLDNRDDALEMVQKTFIQVLEKLNTLRNPNFFKTWLYRIAINLCRNLLQERYSYRRLLTGLPALMATCYEEDHLEKEEQRTLVRELLQLLPEKQRVTIILKVYHNMSYQKIAEILGCQEVTARSHFHLGLKSLGAKLKKKRLFSGNEQTGTDR